MEEAEAEAEIQFVLSCVLDAMLDSNAMRLNVSPIVCWAHSIVHAKLETCVTKDSSVNQILL
jgi:hypothetical protein